MISAQISVAAFYAARVILYFLFLLSILTVAFFLERMLCFARNFLKKNDTILPEIESADSLGAIVKILENRNSAETGVILKGLNGPPLSHEEFARKVSAWLSPEREKWERFSSFLGSVGSNAPFIGLLGTVLGILKSFADLGLSAKGGPQVVMSGISEALIATAVGLGVAIPAVVFFNICKIRVKRSVARVGAMTDMICAKDVFGDK